MTLYSRNLSIKISSLIISLALLIGSSPLSIINTQAANFLDVPADAWFFEYVEKVYTKGIVGGYKDQNGNITGYYGPVDPVTVGQAAKMVAGANQQQESNITGNHWAISWIELFPKTLERRPELRVSLDNPAGREIIAELIAEATNLNPVVGNIFTDTSNPHINAIAEAGFAKGYADGHFLGPVNRAEMAKFASGVSDYSESDINEILSDTIPIQIESSESFNERAEIILSITNDPYLQLIAEEFASRFALPTQEELNNKMGQNYTNWNWIGNNHCKSFEEATSTFLNDQPFFNEFKTLYNTYGFAFIPCPTEDEEWVAGEEKVFGYVIGANKK
jgi:hypothetical protein